MKIIQSYGAGAPELDIFPGPWAQIKIQKQELSLKFRTVAGGMAISEVAPAAVRFLDTNGFAK